MTRATATIIADTDVWPIPGGGHAPNFTLDKGDRVFVVFETLDHKYALVRTPVDGTSAPRTKVGWVATEDLVVNDVLFVDLYWKDLNGRPNLRLFRDDIRYAGVMLKATEGVRYYNDALLWFRNYYQAAKLIGEGRYGDSWFVGAYHYLTMTKSGRDQARFYVDTVHDAGGWDHGTILPVVDVERGPDNGPNANASKATIVKRTVEFIEEVQNLTGKPTILYAGSYLRDAGITGLMGAAVPWIAQYTEALRPRVLAKHKWVAPIMWQFTDGKVCKHPTLPKVSPIGPVDASVYVGVQSVAPLDEFRAVMVRR